MMFGPMNEQKGFYFELEEYYWDFFRSPESLDLSSFSVWENIF